MSHLEKIFISVFFFSNSLYAVDVTEIYRLEDAFHSIDSQTLIVSDLDETLIEPVEDFGHSPWYKYLSKKLIAEGYDKKSALNLLNHVWSRLQFDIDVNPIEPEAPRLLKKVEKKAYRILGLTARALWISERTEQQLRKAKLKWKPFLRTQNAWNHHLNEAVGLRGGILFAGNESKGEVLVKFLSDQKFKPGQIIFVDDLWKHTLSVRDALDSVGIKNQCFKYLGSEERLKNFSPALAEAQLEKYRCSHILRELK
ncbi:MAG: putative rane protein [Bacteriovoracaceae bacterium]|nr:putative rane protein [Bacteriovoracaceae bacterium]